MDKVLFLDFNSVYINREFPTHYIVLTNLYFKKNVINVDANDFRIDALKEYKNFSKKVEAELLNSGYNLQLYNLLIFNNFFYPLSRWILTIEDLLDKEKINLGTEIIFSMYALNSKVFLMEAEGETNRKFLYKSYYYLSYYIREFLEKKGFYNIKILRISSFKVRAHSYFRTRIILLAKFFQLLFYKVLTTNRFHGNNEAFEREFTIFSTRGIIQSDYIKNLYSLEKSKMRVLVNEASSLPFRNYKLAKKLFDTFYYAEGNIKFSVLFKRVEEAFSTLNFNKSISAEFYYLKIDMKDVIPEVALLDFHMKTYSDSINKSIKDLRLKKVNNLVSFEMLYPFSFYLKNQDFSVIQVQTTLLANQVDPSYIYSDKFYYYSEDVFVEQCKLNPEFSNDTDFIGNLKYLNIFQESKKTKIDTIVYFVQPIHIEEELNIIGILNKYCIQNNKRLIIKLHPRSTPNDYYKFKHLEFSNDLPIDVIRKADLVVTRTSSIGLDCWVLNVPVIFFVNGMFKDFRIDYIPNEYLGKITELINEEWLKDNLENIVESFYNHSFHSKLKKGVNEKYKLIFQNHSSNKI